MTAMTKKRPTPKPEPEPTPPVNPWPAPEITAENVTIPTPAEVRAIRDKLGLTRAQAAARIGLSARTWQDYERGEITITTSAALLIRLLEAGKI